jgi:hypothetical protein
MAGEAHVTVPPTINTKYKLQQYEKKERKKERKNCGLGRMYVRFLRRVNMNASQKKENCTAWY